MEWRRLGIDLRDESAIPVHEDVSALVDLVDDPTISGAQTRVIARVLHQFDPRADSDAGTDPRRKKSGTVRIHCRLIGFETQKLYPPTKAFLRRRPRRPGEVALRRRTAPNSTA